MSEPISIHINRGESEDAMRGFNTGYDDAPTGQRSREHYAPDRDPWRAAYLRGYEVRGEREGGVVSDPQLGDRVKILPGNKWAGEVGTIDEAGWVGGFIIYQVLFDEGTGGRVYYIPREPYYAEMFEVLPDGVEKAGGVG